MYPDLSYLLHDLIGTDVDNWTSIFKTFGLMLAMAFITCAWYVRVELKRKEEEGLLKATTKTIEVKGGIDWKEVIYNALVLGFMGLKFPYIYQHFAEFQQDPASILLSGKGTWVIGLAVFVLAAAYSYYVQKKEDRKAGTKTVVVHPHERTGDIIITAAISGVLGSKLLSITENLDAFFQDPAGMLFSGNGLSIYGGVIFGAIAVYLLVRKAGIKPVHMLDIGGPGILLGYAVGRMGCQLSGDGDWGITAAAIPEWWFLPEWLWSYNFPNNVNNSGQLIEGCSQEAYNAVQSNLREVKCLESCGMRYCHELADPVYPTSIYETLISFIGFGIMWIWRKKIKIAGIMFAIYLIWNGVERFFIEFVRVNPKYGPEGGRELSQAQFISIAFIIAGVAAVYYLWKHGERIPQKGEEVA